MATIRDTDRAVRRAVSTVHSITELAVVIARDLRSQTERLRAVEAEATVVRLTVTSVVRRVARDVVKGGRPDLLHLALGLVILGLGCLAISCHLDGWCPRRRAPWEGANNDDAGGGGDEGERKA